MSAKSDVTSLQISKEEKPLIFTDNDSVPHIVPSGTLSSNRPKRGQKCAFAKQVSFI